MRLVGKNRYRPKLLIHLFMRTLKFRSEVVAILYIGLVLIKPLDAKETLGAIQSQDAINSQKTIDSPISGHGFTVPLGVHYSHLRGYYGNVGLLSGDIIGEGS